MKRIAVASAAIAAITAAMAGEGVQAPVQTPSSSATGSALAPMRLQSPEPGSKVTFALPPEVTGLVSNWTIADKFVSIGTLNERGHQQLDIFDLKTGEHLDSLWGLDFTPSPDRTQVAFVRFYPVTAAGTVEDQYMTFNLLEPRKGKVLPQDLERRMKGGVLLYPAHARDNVQVAELDAHRRLSRFTWSASGGELAFLDAIRDQPYLVVVAFQGASGRTVQRRLVTQLAPLCSVRSSATCENVSLSQLHLALEADAVAIEVHQGRQGGHLRTVKVNRTGLSPVPN